MSEDRHEANSDIIDQLQAQLDRKQARIAELESQLRAVALYTPHASDDDTIAESRALAFATPPSRTKPALASRQPDDSLFRPEQPRIKLDRFGTGIPDIANMVFRAANAQERVLEWPDTARKPIPDVESVQHIPRFADDESGLDSPDRETTSAQRIIHGIDWRLVLLLIAIGAMAMSLRSLSRFSPFARASATAGANRLFSINIPAQPHTADDPNVESGAARGAPGSAITVLPADPPHRATNHSRKHKRRPFQPA